MTNNHRICMSDLKTCVVSLHRPQRLESISIFILSTATTLLKNLMNILYTVLCLNYILYYLHLTFLCVTCVYTWNRAHQAFSQSLFLFQAPYSSRIWTLEKVDCFTKPTGDPTTHSLMNAKHSGRTLNFTIFCYPKSHILSLAPESSAILKIHFIHCFYQYKDRGV